MKSWTNYEINGVTADGETPECLMESRSRTEAETYFRGCPLDKYPAIVLVKVVYRYRSDPADCVADDDTLLDYRGDATALGRYRIFNS